MDVIERLKSFGKIHNKKKFRGGGVGWGGGGQGGCE